MNLDRGIYQEFTQPMLSHINVGTGEDCSIAELAQTLAKVIGYQGKLTYDTSKPDGAPRKLMDVSRLQELGWKARIKLEEGLQDAYSWFIENQGQARG
jgi:GDP-L-fucose synthase